MEIIAHRANLYGPSHLENHPKQVDECISRGYGVEIDIWDIAGTLYLGHDMPRHKISIEYLLERGESLYIHTKNLAALRKLLGLGLNHFWHQNDAFTLTNKGQIWTYPDQEITDQSIIVCESKEDLSKYFESDVYGVCTDYPVHLETMSVCS